MSCIRLKATFITIENEFGLLIQAMICDHCLPSIPTAGIELVGKIACEKKGGKIESYLDLSWELRRPEIVFIFPQTRFTNSFPNTVRVIVSM